MCVCFTSCGCVWGQNVLLSCVCGGVCVCVYLNHTPAFPPVRPTEKMSVYAAARKKPGETMEEYADRLERLSLRTRGELPADDNTTYSRPSMVRTGDELDDSAVISTLAQHNRVNLGYDELLMFSYCNLPPITQLLAVHVHGDETYTHTRIHSHTHALTHAYTLTHTCIGSTPSCSRTSASSR